MWERWKPFEGLERFLREIEKLDFEKASGDARYFGYSAYVGPDGVPHMKTFGNIAGLEDGMQEWPGLEAGLNGAREPYADVLVDEKNKEVIITAEMPGIKKEDVKLNATETGIEISAETEDRKYRKHLPLKVEIDPENTHAEYNNGILEIRAALKARAEPQGQGIKVD